MTRHLLGIDNGGTMAKAGLFTETGQEIAVASRRIELLQAPQGWAEIDAEALWRATAEAIAQVVEQARIDPAHIAAIACTGFGNGLFLVDEHAHPVRPAIASSDNRAGSYIDTWRDAGIGERMRPRTLQSIWAAQPNALLRWLMDHEPQSLRRARWVMMCKDFIRAKLTGQCAAELTDMSGTSLMNVVTGEYDEAVLDAWGLQSLRHLLPPLVSSEQICGPVTDAAAALTGLRPGTPVVGGMFDIDACGLASAMVDQRPLCIVSGTWGNNQSITPEAPVDADIFMTSRYCINGYYLMLEGSATSASNLEWMLAQCRGIAGETSGSSLYDHCNQLVAQTTPSENGPMYLPFAYGCNVHPHGKACLIDCDGWQGAGDLLRAVYEGVVFSHRWHTRRLLRYRAEPELIRLTGGAARSRAWSQMFADIFQWPVEIPAGTELGALGAAICAAVGAGVYDSYQAACAAMVRIDRRHDPDPRLAGLYQRKYDRYLDLLDTMQPVWSRSTQPA